MLTTIEKMLFINRSAMFKSFSLDNLLAISAIAREETFAKGTVLFNEGEEGDTLYLIVDGKAAVKKGTKVVALLGPNQCVGEMAIFSNEPRSATVEALEDITSLVIDKKSFTKLIWKNPDMAFPIFDVLTARLRETTEKLTEISGAKH